MKARDKTGKFTYNGNVKTHKGYVVVYQPGHPHSRCNGYVYEHILVAESILGRNLRDGEVVHHIDGNKLNNSPDNIFVFPSQREHLKHHGFERANKYTLKDGRVVTIMDLSKETGVSHSTIYQRLRKLNWSPDEILEGRR